MWFEILSLVCLIECHDDRMKENLVVLFRKDNRPSAPGEGFILELVLSDSTSPDCFINNGIQWNILFEILCLVCLPECQNMR